MIDMRPRRRLQLQTGLELDLCYSLAAVYRLQTALGRGLRPDEAGCVSMSELRALLWAMHQGPETMQTIGANLHLSELGKVIEAVSVLIRSSTIRGGSGAGSSEPAGDMIIDWLDLWAIAKIDMRLTTEEFWSLTPGMFYALLERLKRKYGVKEEVSKEEQVASVLRKVEAINAAMGGRDLRGTNGS